MKSTDNHEVDLASFNNDWYDTGAGIFKRAFWYLFNLLFFKNPLNVSSSSKRFLLKLFGAKIGKAVVIKPSVNIKYPWKLSVGSHSWIGEGVWIDNLGFVEIGKNVCISQGAMLLCGNHDYSKSSFDLIVGDITLGDGSWIGAKSMVTGGVIVNKNAVLSAGSISSKDLEENKIYRGNPAIEVKIRRISE